MTLQKYAIGTSPDNLDNVEDLGTNVKRKVGPRGLAVQEHSIMHTSASGLVYGDGFPVTQWEFDGMEQAQFDALMNLLNGAQSAWVYIITRKSDRTYGKYRAVMHRPTSDEMTPGRGFGWKNITVRFTMLQEMSYDDNGD